MDFITCLHLNWGFVPRACVLLDVACLPTAAAACYRMATSVHRGLIGSYQISNPVCVVEGMALPISKAPHAHTALY
jgi:hypothetical protein